MRFSSAWASSSRRVAMRAATGAALGILALLFWNPVSASAKVFLSQREALALAFPGADRIDRKTYVLSREQVVAVEKRSRAPLESKIVTFHRGLSREKVLGYAFIDVHTVRTLPEALMVVLEPDGRVRSLRVLAFYEPLDYLPTERWYTQFEGKALAEPLRLGRDIHGVVGATLSARAASAGVRRALALHEVLVMNGKSGDNGTKGN